MAKKFILPKNIEEYVDLRVAESNSAIDQDVLNVLDRWYDAYQKIVTFLGTASGIVLLYMGLHLIELVPDDPSIRNSVIETITSNRNYIYAGVSSLILAIVSMIICLVTTYNWYKTGLRRVLTSTKSAKELERLLGDDMQYESLRRA